MWPLLFQNSTELKQYVWMDGLDTMYFGETDWWTSRWQYLVFHALSSLTSGDHSVLIKAHKNKNNVLFYIKKRVYNVAASTLASMFHFIHPVPETVLCSLCYLYQDNTLGSATCNRNIQPWLCEAARFHSVSQSLGCRNNQTEHLISSHCAALCCPSSFCQGLPNWEGNLFLSVTKEKHR